MLRLILFLAFHLNTNMKREKYALCFLKSTYTVQYLNIMWTTLSLLMLYILFTLVIPSAVPMKNWQYSSHISTGKKKLSINLEKTMTAKQGLSFDLRKKKFKSISKHLQNRVYLKHNPWRPVQKVGKLFPSPRRTLQEFAHRWSCNSDSIKQLVNLTSKWYMHTSKIWNIRYTSCNNYFEFAYQSSQIVGASGYSSAKFSRAWRNPSYYNTSKDF